MNENTPTLQNIDQVSDGWIKKYVLTYELPDGSPHIYEAVSRKNLQDFSTMLKAAEKGQVMRQSDAVCIVARTPRDTLVMIREFRYPINSWCLGFPAGLVDPGEDLATCAARELREETGYELVPGAPITVLPQAGLSSTGLTDEAVQVVFVEADRATDAHCEPGELIEVFELPLAGLRDFLDANTTPMGTRAQLVLEMFARES